MNSKTDEEKKRARAEGCTGFTVSAFPIELYKQWKEDCEKDFGDCHWIKIWHDHVQAKYVDKFEELDKRIKALESKGEEKKEEQEGTAITFRGKIKGGV